MNFKSFFNGYLGSASATLTGMKTARTALELELAGIQDPKRYGETHETIEDLTTEILFEELVANVSEGKQLTSGRDQIRRAFAVLSGHHDLAFAVLGMIEVAIHHGAPIYNRGSHIGCAYLYDYSARLMLRLLAAPSGQKPLFQAAYTRLRLVSFERIRSEAEAANQRAWELRHAFDDILAILSSKDDGKVRVFVSYSHKDENLRAELSNHLALLRHQGVISDWYDGEILAGGEWGREIVDRLENADIILLLVSADYLASKFCFGMEMKRALERHDEGSARVIPIILRSADWKNAPFGKLQALPKDGRAVMNWPDKDAALADAALGIRRVIEHMVSAL